MNTNNHHTFKAVVYCSSSADIDSLYFDSARTLGKLFAEEQIACVNGAGSKGLMGSINDSILENGGHAIGIIPRFMVDAGWCHTDLSETIITETIHERKSKMAQMADAVVALPGGVGTLEELLEIITWKQLGLFNHPIIILNVNCFYTPLLEMLQQLIKQRFLKVAQPLWHVVETEREVIYVLKSIKG